MKRYGLIGYPLSHSFSATYFAEKFKINNIQDVIYQNFPIENINEFENLIFKYPDLVGLNVTIPYKQQVIPYLDELDKTAKDVGAVNTVKFIRKDDDKLILKGYNTDVYGIERSLQSYLLPEHRTALILGTGGASKAVVFILNKIGIKSQLVSRNKTEKIFKTYDELSIDDIKDFDLIINTTPVGMYPKVNESPKIPYEGIHSKQIIFDLIYNPDMTVFLLKGKEKGAKTLNGLEMLKFQADKSWQIWNFETSIDFHESE